MQDIIVIGKGPAGISAAIYAKRAGKTVTVIARDGGALEKVTKIDNYYGVPSISGPELLNKGLEQAKSLGIALIEDEITDISYDGKFRLKGKNTDYIARSVILATGAPRKKPNIKGLDAYEGRGVSYCAVCDGFFFRKKHVAVIGGGEYALEEASVLAQTAEKVTILTDGTRQTVFPAGTDVIDKKIAEIIGAEKVSSVRFTDGTELAVSGVFVAIGVAGSSEFAKKLGLVTKNGHLVTDGTATAIGGLYAAGDCTEGIMQVSKAVSDGANAALSAVAYLNSTK